MIVQEYYNIVYEGVFMELTGKMYKQLFLSARIGLSLNRMDGTFVEFNQELLNMTGYTKDEFLKLSYWDLTPSEYEKKEEEQLLSLKNSKKYGPYEKEYFHKKGHRIDVLLQGTIVTNEEGEEFIWSTVQDISDTKKAEKVLNKAQEMGNIGHWYLDLTNNNLEWSDETYRIFGLKPQEFDATYEAFVERIYPDDRDAVNTAYGNSVTIDEPYQIEHRVIRPSGEVRYVIERCEHYHSQKGEIIGSIGTVLDITERKSIENALLDAKNRAESSSISKSSFIASMSHELRTPLNAILGFSNRLSVDETLNEQQRKYIGIINSSGEHLLSMINDILDLSKVEAGEMRVNNSEFNLLESVSNVTDLMSLGAKSKNLQCHYFFDDSVPKTIVSDKGKIRQILLNIIGNAVKFTDSGTITVTISATDIENRDNFKMIKIEISDTGCGIQESMRDEVFKPFVQNDGLKKVEGGTGLGLAISKNIVHLLGGTISLKSEVGEGSTFYVNIPVEARVDTAPLPKDSTITKQERVTVPKQAEMSEMEKLPSDTVDAISDAAKKGKGLNIKKELSKIESSHVNSYRHLSSLAAKYDFDAILEFLKENDE